MRVTRAIPLLLLLPLVAGMAMAQELDTSDLKPSGPPYDSSKYDFTTGTTKIQPAGEAPAGKKTLTIQVKTLQDAMVAEKDFVDWYAWYLSARDYLSATGGLQCPVGTQIKFYKSGMIQAESLDPDCMASVTGKTFALPKTTKLDALLLPVRNGKEAPASPDELFSRIDSQSKRRF